MVPRLHKETSLFRKNAISGGIQDAASRASSYIFKTTGHDAWVCDEGAGPQVDGADAGEPYGPSAVHPTTGWRIGEAFELVRQGVSWFRLWLDETVAPSVMRLRLGKADSGHLMLDSTGMDVMTDASTSVAKFGSSGARIGKPFLNGGAANESHIELDYRSMKMIDKNNIKYFEILDLREANGYATIAQTFRLTSRAVLFYVDFDIRSTETTTATVDGSQVTVSATENTSGANPLHKVTLSAYAEAGSTVVITYQTNSFYAKAYTIGIRDDSFDVGGFSLAEGYQVAATNFATHAEGEFTQANGVYSHAEGKFTEANGECSHVEGYYSTANGAYSHAEGSFAQANNVYSHAEGLSTEANEPGSHAEGFSTKANGAYSHTQNEGTTASKEAQTVIGLYNKVDTATTTTHSSNNGVYGRYAFIVGNGSGDNDAYRSNAAALTWAGDLELAGDIGSSSSNIANGYFTNINGVAVGSSPEFTDTHGSISTSDKTGTTDTAVSVGDNSSASVSATCDVPSGYTFAGIFELTTDQATKCGIVGYSYSSGTLHARVRNFTSNAVNVKVTFKARFIKVT